mmetsp:Transcript_8233/g.28017  ORF Transcript_8233/g.28017 Transcript_8233/m.28017 type:complete len:238 (-) Transcript_8233:31-744(-)
MCPATSPYVVSGVHSTFASAASSRGVRCESTGSYCSRYCTSTASRNQKGPRRRYTSLVNTAWYHACRSRSALQSAWSLHRRLSLSCLSRFRSRTWRIQQSAALRTRRLWARWSSWESTTAPSCRERKMRNCSSSSSLSTVSCRTMSSWDMACASVAGAWLFSRFRFTSSASFLMHATSATAVSSSSASKTSTVLGFTAMLKQCDCSRAARPAPAEAPGATPWDTSATNAMPTPMPLA